MLSGARTDQIDAVPKQSVSTAATSKAIERGTELQGPRKAESRMNQSAGRITEQALLQQC